MTDRTHWVSVALHNGTVGSLEMPGDCPNPSYPSTWAKDKEALVGKHVTVWIVLDEADTGVVESVIDVHDTDPCYPA